MKVWLLVFGNSRLDYRYPPHGHWDSRDDPGYHSYYRGEHPQQPGTWHSTAKHLQHLHLHLNSQWCSSGWRCRTLGLTGSLVDGAAPRTTAPVGTFRELLCRGIQVGNKMGVGLCWKIFIFVRFLECIKSADQTWGIWHHLVDRNMSAFLRTNFFPPKFWFCVTERTRWLMKRLIWLLRYDQWRDAPEPRPTDQVDFTSRNHLELHPHYSGTLESSKNSGLSSSSFELSQYINGAELSEAPPTSHTGESVSEGPLCQLHVSSHTCPRPQSTWRRRQCCRPRWSSPSRTPSSASVPPDSWSASVRLCPPRRTSASWKSTAWRSAGRI